MPFPPSRRRALMAAAAAVAATAVASCGGGGESAGGCGPILRESLDPSYLVHVLPTATDVEYRSDPPTSGPHQPAPSQTGVVDEPLSGPVQVGILERGDILIQHDPALGDADRAALEALAGDGVVVAPNPDLSEPVVATAWVFKRSCEAVDVDALEEFVSERAGQGPEG